ncbi:MAG: HAMP domain-containing sensor histidine kinase [Thermodesulfobacteriota bacterium]|nr:HAMP domain-containing sensor histidine kinase [Thermodesulfobacteriota bacterium]
MGKQKIKLEFLIHDLKVPLAIIEAGIISLLKREDKYGPLTEKQQKVLTRVLRNTNITKTLVNDTLEVGRSTEGIINKNKIVLSGFIEQSLVELFDLVDCDAADSIKSCGNLSVLKQKLSEHGILLHIDDGLWCHELSLDERKMGQILRNLLNNALKYRKAQVVVKIEISNGCLLISVSDDGQGIPETYHKNIFESYFQMDQKKDHCVRGHGLGLAGVMVLVEDMGGELLLESDVGKGAKFSVRVPIGSS